LGKAILREYQEERDQQVMFLLDCGRRMRTAEGGRAEFEAVLDAVLLTAQAALRQGDLVGLMTFSGARRWLAPRKGMTQQHALLNALYDLESSAEAPDSTSAARDLTLRVRKRSLVVLVSNVRDEDADERGACLELLASRHLVLLASLRERALASTLSGNIDMLATRFVSRPRAATWKRALPSSGGRQAEAR
jgi:uncharacterized protein (DUF58 family)